MLNLLLKCNSHQFPGALQQQKSGLVFLQSSSFLCFFFAYTLQAVKLSISKYCSFKLLNIFEGHFCGYIKEQMHLYLMFAILISKLTTMGLLNFKIWLIGTCPDGRSLRGLMSFQLNLALLTLTCNILKKKREERRTCFF